MFPEMPPELRKTFPLPFWNWWQAARRFLAMLLEGGGNGEVLAKQSNADFDVAWVLPGTVGGGVGDMLKSVYDPTGIGDDAFARANHTGTQLLVTVSDFPSGGTTSQILAKASSTDYDMEWIDMATDPLVGYRISDMDDAGDPAYYGFEDKDGNWYIMEYSIGASTFRYAKGTSGYAAGWAGRGALSYALFETTF
jgi:hypothetical protein